MFHFMNNIHGFSRAVKLIASKNSGFTVSTFSARHEITGVPYVSFFHGDMAWFYSYNIHFCVISKLLF